MEGIDYKNFDIVSNKLRAFFRDVKGFREVHSQNKLSILAACEDPKTIAKYDYEGQVWPLPQTGQMWLEHYLLVEYNSQRRDFLQQMLLHLIFYLLV